MTHLTHYSRRAFTKALGTTIGLCLFAAGPAVAGDSVEPTVELPRFFDAHKYLGPGFPAEPDFPTVASLLAEMDRLHTERALVWHTAARTAQPLAGNRQLIVELDAAGARERLVPAFVIAPSLAEAGELRETFLDLVRRENVRAFRYFPRTGGGGLDDLDPLMNELAERNPVLLLDCFESLGVGPILGRIIGFTKRHPTLTLVFTNAMWVHHDRLYELMAAAPNIRMELSLVHTYRTIEYVVREFGAERMLFGSGYKSNYGAAIANLVHTPMTAAQRDLVAHGNLEKLLGIRQPLRGTQTLTGDTLWHRLLRQVPLGPEIIDAHAHMGYGSDEWEDHTKPGTIEDHVEHAMNYLNGMGVSRMIIAEHTPYQEGEIDGVTRLERAAAKYPGRLNAYVSGQVFLREDPDTLPPKLDVMFARGFYVGFKTHTDHWKVPIDDPRFEPMWAYANDHRLPILLHTWSTEFASPKLLRDILGRYPDAFFVLAHSGNRHRAVIEELMEVHRNVYFEWAGSFVNPDDWRPVLDRQGNQRLVWGADGVTWEHRWGHSPAWEMGRFLSMGLSDERLLPMLGSNMARILSAKR